MAARKKAKAAKRSKVAGRTGAGKEDPPARKVKGGPKIRGGPPVRRGGPAKASSLLGPLESITLHVDRFDEALAFYRDTLGLDVDEVIDSDEARFASFRIRDGLALGIHGPPHEAGGRAPGGASGFFFHVDDVDETVARLREKGVKVVEEPGGTPWGRLAVIADPDGNTLGIQTLEG